MSLKFDSDEVPETKDDSTSSKSDGFFIMDRQDYYVIEPMSDKTFVLQFAPLKEEVHMSFITPKRQSTTKFLKKFRFTQTL